MDIDKIQRLTREYAYARDKLADRVAALQAEIEATKRQYMRGIKNAVRAASEARDKLHSAIEQNPHLFKRPRTLVVNGIRIGIQKGKGQVVYDDPAKLIELIRKHYPERADALIVTRETPVKKALATLSVAELKKIGARVEESGDQVVIRATDTEVDKLVAALLRDAEKIEPDEAA